MPRTYNCYLKLIVTGQAIARVQQRQESDKSSKSLVVRELLSKICDIHRSQPLDKGPHFEKIKRRLDELAQKNYVESPFLLRARVSQELFNKFIAIKTAIAKRYAQETKVEKTGNRGVSQGVALAVLIELFLFLSTPKGSADQEKEAIT